MIDAALMALALAAAPQAAAGPMQRCDIRTQAWCLVQAGIHFDVITANNEMRVWTLRSRSIGTATVRIVEDRGCSSYPSDIQSKSEGPGRSAVDGSARYVIRWKLHKDGSCNLSIEIPIADGVRDGLAYELAVSGLDACTDDRCTGPSLKSSR